MEKMKLENLIDTRNEALYNRVASYFKIDFGQNEDWRADAWTSYIENGVAYIKYCDEEVEYPKAALTHELLCLDIQIKGFKRVYTGISLNENVQGKISTLIKCLDIDFQNHRIATTFTNLGFPSEQFYGYENIQSSDYFLNVLDEKDYSLLSICIMYLHFIAPFGSWSSDEKATIQRKFETYQNGEYQKHLKKIDIIIKEWKAAKDYDATPFMIDFCRNAGVTDTWISYRKDKITPFENRTREDGFSIL